MRKNTANWLTLLVSFSFHRVLAYISRFEISSIVYRTWLSLYHIIYTTLCIGILDAVAELLIFEVDAFDIDCPVENRTIRKLIASTLTNLTFGNAQSKRRLCTHPNLIEYTIRIIDDSHGLAQVYNFCTYVVCMYIFACIHIIEFVLVTLFCYNETDFFLRFMLVYYGICLGWQMHR